MDASSTAVPRRATGAEAARRATNSHIRAPAFSPFAPGTTNLSTFSYLFSELVQYTQSRVDNTGDLERRLEEVGRVFGGSLLELLHARNSIPPSSLPKENATSKSAKYSGGSPLLYQAHPGIRYAPNGVVRYTRILDVLRFLYTTVWRYLFNKQATDLQQSNENDDEYMLSDDEAHLWIGKYVSVPKEMGHLNVYAWLGGVVQGVLGGAGFPCRVTAHFVPTGEDEAAAVAKKEAGEAMAKSRHQRVTLLIKLDAEVMARERELERAASSLLL